MSLLRNLEAQAKGEARRSKKKGQNPKEPIKDFTPEGYVAMKVGSLDRMPQKSRGGAGYIHGSSLIGLCPRRYALMIRGGGTKYGQVKSADRIVWAIGRAVETHIRNQFISAVGEIVVGGWVCNCGEKKSQGFQPKGECGVCGSEAKHYKELAVFDHDHRIVGSPDILYVRPDTNKLRVNEIKSINKREFDLLESPKMDHVWQAMIYRRLLTGQEADVDHSVSVIYGCKDYSFKGSPYKEYTIRVDKWHEEALDRMWALAAAVRDFLKGEKAGDKPPLPPRIEPCQSPENSKPKGCDECTACFSLK